ncbi:hypothetical protein BDV95DRAFT_586089 [Massariosphaeria phaeospora]|uniref:Uncharacterized protein n=1 Tax=Massariosphaeria phaeospora TaxID=100035 RepID=A0A7C8M773_9PLEO|nr:hypothetical protein BDV95DRAFT_586089 [Massariosphaeria phaeospora]
MPPLVMSIVHCHLSAALNGLDGSLAVAPSQRCPQPASITRSWARRRPIPARLQHLAEVTCMNFQSLGRPSPLADSFHKVITTLHSKHQLIVSCRLARVRPFLNGQHPSVQRSTCNIVCRDGWKSHDPRAPYMSDDAVHVANALNQLESPVTGCLVRLDWPLSTHGMDNVVFRSVPRLRARPRGSTRP